MAWRPRLVALDVDGTIVDHDNQLSPAVKDAILALREQGIPVVIATGRAVPGVYDVLDKLGFREGLGVASNGSVVFEVDPFEVVHTTTFDAREAVRRVLERVPEALVAVEEVGVGYRVNRAFPHGEISGDIILDEVERMVSQPVTRVVVRAPDHDRDKFSSLVEDLGLEGTNYYIGYTAWLDLAPEGVSKASGLDVVCHRMGLTAADVLAVGDGNNDLEMLQWAGRGVAMGQAPDELKAAADDVTGAVEEDGLAAELRRWLD
ncbi:HAD-IIB family hydrolase [Aeromicrobium sp. 636]|uniref:HAD family phosphatase n=1 Tax=Aeromicrobium senzhongii TaxID=2663859 RepID=A0A8I0EVA1_9ACTN|nr:MULTISPECIES: HAD family hydrolase [Aeromicrobium]MBC9227041.1 HAD family phosphatase [Aeromicrobium senzhongii]MCQ3999141.1 HAD-IIB family hydrolase [Aeromicrobium sp. 636]MTB89358.1 HAD-IIB family hydrolase [Aeromicrobium senzhongii]QNL94490.1 HAD family phosphatase [Aeromicrobium senzhongii]